MNVLPESGMPILACGKHHHPRDGACLMEYVSVLAGEKFSDRPRCTDDLLAHTARMVNDASSPGGRSTLARLAPDLATAGKADASTHERMLETCFAVARVAGAASQPHRMRAGIFTRNKTARLRDVERVVRALRSVPLGTQRDAALHTLLCEAVATFHTTPSTRSAHEPAKAELAAEPGRAHQRA